MTKSIPSNIINLARDDWETGTVDDYFSQSFYEYANQKAKEEIDKNNYLNDKSLIGYCTGEEMRWGKDWRSDKSIVFDYLNFSETQEGKKALIHFLKELYDEDITRFNRDWFQSFTNWDEALSCQTLFKNEEIGKKQ